MPISTVAELEATCRTKGGIMPDELPPMSTHRGGFPIAKVRTFLAVVEHLHFGRAAKATGMSQPALSNQIKSLEEALQVRLLVRSTRRVTLTPEGEHLAMRMRGIFDDMDNVLDEIAETALNKRNRIRFACIPSVSATVIPQSLKMFLNRHPTTMIDFSDEPSLAMEGRVIRGELDFGIGQMPSWSEEIEFMPIAKDFFLVVMRPDSPLARFDELSIDSLVNYPMISPSKGVKLRAQLEHQFSQRGLKYASSYGVTHPSTIGAMVEEGLGISIIPSSFIVLMTNTKSLHFVRIREKALFRYVGILKPSDKVLPPTTVDLCDIITEELRRSLSADYSRIVGDVL